MKPIERVSLEAPTDFCSPLKIFQFFIFYLLSQNGKILSNFAFFQGGGGLTLT
jgi:hypothetical protein